MSADIYGDRALIFSFNSISLSFLFMELEERKGRRVLGRRGDVANVGFSKRRS